MQLSPRVGYAGDRGAGALLRAGRPSATTRRPGWDTSLGAPSGCEIADGWIPTMFVPDQAAEIWGAAGAAKRPAELGPLQVVADGPLAMGDDVEHLRDLARGYYALYIGGWL
jgi:hypothetical protein